MAVIWSVATIAALFGAIAGAIFEGKSRRGKGEAELQPNLEQAVDRVERAPFVFKEA